MPEIKKNKTKIDPVMAALANIEKQLGNKDEPVINRIGEIRVPKNSISFGYPEVDEASYCGGATEGGIIEIYGPESGGKSLLTLKLISSAQKRKSNCVLIDVEQSFDADWAQQQGVDVDNLYLVNKPMSAEKILDYVNAIAESGQFGLVVVDSTAAMVPEKEVEGSVSDQDYALLARAMSKGLRKIIGKLRQNKVTVVFVNQIREKMGVTYGDPTTTPGGKALKFYSHQRIRVTPGSIITVKEGEKETPVAKKSYVKFIKNKSARPGGECEIQIVFDSKSLNPVVRLVSLAKEANLVSIYKGEYRLDKELFEDEKKNVATATYNFIDLADYLIKNNFVVVLIDALAAAIENKEVSLKMPKEILELKSDPTKIVSPNNLVMAEKIIKKEIEEDFSDNSDNEIEEIAEIEKDV